MLEIFVLCEWWLIKGAPGSLRFRWNWCCKWLTQKHRQYWLLTKALTHTLIDTDTQQPVALSNQTTSLYFSVVVISEECPCSTYGSLVNANLVCACVLLTVAGSVTQRSSDQDAGQVRREQITVGRRRTFTRGLCSVWKKKKQRETCQMCRHLAVTTAKKLRWSGQAGPFTCKVVLVH